MRGSRLLTFLLLATQALAGDSAPDGLSTLGSAFDSGPRRKPWRITGLGKVHFPITTSAPDAQEWFDQGLALLHVFFYNEAERAFRWVAKRDPDCAMAYWGMAASTFDKERRPRVVGQGEAGYPRRTRVGAVSQSPWRSCPAAGADQVRTLEGTTRG